jgi:hypothetical protein
LGIFSTCVNADTIDESPMAYKKPEEIKKYIVDTLSIDLTMNPKFNFKAQE